MANRRFDKDRCQAVKFDRCHSASFKITNWSYPGKLPAKPVARTHQPQNRQVLDLIAPKMLLATAAEVVD
jgi:hypothetical protein